MSYVDTGCQGLGGN